MLLMNDNQGNMNDSTDFSPIPVTILTGFLGAGKTTLLNYLLENSANERIAIIENEFASENIDGALIKKTATTEVIELANGCVCCTIKGAFFESLLALHQQSLLARRHGKAGFDRLIVETTGLADPSPIIQSFFINTELHETFMLDGVIVLVDAQHTLTHLKQYPVCASQIGFADKIIVSKQDLIDDVALEALLAQLFRINQKAPIVFAVQGAIESSEWLNLHAFHLNDESPVAEQPVRFRLRPDVSPNGRLIQTNLQDIQSYDQSINSHVIKTIHPLDLDKIGEWMEKLIENFGHDLLRYKGILFIEGESRKLIVQGIHKVVGFDYGDDWGDMQKESILVLIGRNLKIDDIENDFNQCIIK